VNGSTVTTFARDGQKSIRAELNGSSVNASWRYRAYGDVVQYSGSATPALLGYAGQLLDPSGIYYMRARWYDPVNARFLSRDPAPFNVAPLRANGFDYAATNPVLFTDPSGYCPMCWGAFFGAVSYVIVQKVTGQEITPGGLIASTLLGAATGGISALAPTMAAAGFGGVGGVVIRASLGEVAGAASGLVRAAIDQPSPEDAVTSTYGSTITGGIAAALPGGTIASNSVRGLVGSSGFELGKALLSEGVGHVSGESIQDANWFRMLLTPVPVGGPRLTE
jgi:RHS repeat-associated protein